MKKRIELFDKLENNFEAIIMLATCSDNTVRMFKNHIDHLYSYDWNDDSLLEEFLICMEAHAAFLS